MIKIKSKNIRLIAACLRKTKTVTVSSFTLMELVVAVALITIVFITAGTALSGVQQSWKTVTNHSDRLMKRIMIDKVVNANFRNIIPFKWRDRKLLKNRQIFFGKSDQIIFATTHRVNDTQEGGIRFLSIFVEDDQLIAMYQKTPILYWDMDKESGNSEVLAEHVKSIEFTYGDLNSKREIEWFDNWDEEKEPFIPMAIQMTVNWDDGTSDVWLRRTAGASKRSNFGRKIYPNRN